MSDEEKEEDAEKTIRRIVRQELENHEFNLSPDALKAIKEASKPETPTKKCSDCGHNLTGTERYCPECGEDTEGL